ncbi:MAG: hypothetical protein L0Z62_19095 [Gemmataceae bacterium]|nr:hypothetical protein [Gemmataceae bacterium]
MRTVDEIFAAIQQLDATQFLQLRKRMERLEKKIWRAERARATAEFHRANLPAPARDRPVLPRRRERRR